MKKIILVILSLFPIEKSYSQIIEKYDLNKMIAQKVKALELMPTVSFVLDTTENKKAALYFSETKNDSCFYLAESSLKKTGRWRNMNVWKGIRKNEHEILFIRITSTRYITIDSVIVTKNGIVKKTNIYDIFREKKILVQSFATLTLFEKGKIEYFQLEPNNILELPPINFELFKNYPVQEFLGNESFINNEEYKIYINSFSFKVLSL